VADDELERRLEASGYDRPGFAARYDACRPQPPAALLDLLPALAGVERPKLVVDLGSGTGLSTRVWAERAHEVVGVEPNAEICRFAAHATGAGNVRYVERSAYDTGLADGCADIVTASQSLHWMRPERVFPEIGRLLRVGGVLCGYAYVSLQTPLWEPEECWAEVRARTGELREKRGLVETIWPVSRERLEESGVFRSTRELALHSVEHGDGDRLVGLALSEGSLATLLEAGVGEEEVGLDRLRLAAAKISKPVPWWIGYRVWLGLK
jgi:SAM-dependent methyltransferase